MSYFVNKKYLSNIVKLHLDTVWFHVSGGKLHKVAERIGLFGSRISLF